MKPSHIEEMFVSGQIPSARWAANVDDENIMGCAVMLLLDFIDRNTVRQKEIPFFKI